MAYGIARRMAAMHAGSMARHGAAGRRWQQRHGGTERVRLRSASSQAMEGRTGLQQKAYSLRVMAK